MNLATQIRHLKHATREQLIRLIEQDGLRTEVQEQFKGPQATLETVQLAELQDLMANLWDPETESEGLTDLRNLGIVK